MAHPPLFIISSRLADERLWAEALNLGAYDVLAKPFDAREVLHAFSRALRHWSTVAPKPFEEVVAVRAGSAAA
jgi:DNA-binding response OmpR family regulator